MKYFGKYFISVSAIIFLFLTIELTKGERHPVYDFATKLLQQVALEKGISANILISPYSIRTALAIVYLGARGQTAAEIQKTLHLPSSENDIIKTLSRQISTSQSSETSTFKIGNGLFLDKNFSVNETLVSKIKSELGSTVQPIDFKNDPSGSANTINNWISRVTKGNIQNLVSPSSNAVPTFSFLLANALFYSGQWAKPFTVLPKKQLFKLDSGSPIKVTMMGLQSEFGFSYIPELRSTGISLPFKDDRFSFIILKPDDGQTVDSVRPLLNNYPLEKLENKLEDNLRTVVLSLPKFTLKANYDTINVLRKMGISSLFDPQTSNLSGLAISTMPKPSVVSRMVHQTLLDINELGATGAAGTALSGYPISVASSLDVDKPFLFLLNDRLTGPVLIGQLVNPTQ